VIEVESMSGLERLTVPEAGGMEAFVTSGGASIGPVLFEGKLETYSYKTLRFPGHFAAMKAYRDLGLWSKEPSRPGGEPLRELFTRLFLERTAEEDPQDQVILLVEAWGRRTRRTRLFLRETFDEKTGLSAMERMTGFCASIVLQKTLGAGLTPALYAAEEVVSGREMLAELSRRGIVPRKA
jgi:lysine 6-dehydrogenase